MELVNQIDETICFNENNIRILGSYNEPWFVVKDICNILEIKDNRSALRIIPDKWKGEQILPSLGGKQITSIVNEAGLYKLIMRSNKPIAEKFQDVVCEEILPNLRKKGEYKIQSILDKNKELEDKLKEETYIRKNLKAKYEHFLEKRIDIEKYKKGQLIYLIGFEELPNKYKIGYTRNLNKRLEKGKTDVPFDAIVLYKRYFSLPDPIKIEKITHYALRKFRMKNCKEWFKTDDVYNSQTFIDQIDEVVSFFEMIDKKYKNKKDIKYEQLKKYIEQEKLEKDDEEEKEKDEDEEDIDEEKEDDEEKDEDEEETDEYEKEDETDEYEKEDETNE